MSTIPVNPPAAQLGSTHAILWGRGNRSYYSPEFPGPLSIKSILRGYGEWRSGARSFRLDSFNGGGGSYLLFNQSQPYSLTIETQKPVETFCVFFRTGFIEDAWRSATLPAARLLDRPCSEPIEFRQEICPRDSLISPILDRMHRRLAATRDPEDSDFDALAEALLWLRPEYQVLLARLPAMKYSTRVELAARVSKARDFLEGSMADSSVKLVDAARAACLSPFHLQRTFRQLFGETPRDFLSRRRMESAAHKLANEDIPVTEVCLQCGFESLGSFSTAFRQRFQMPPRAYREKFAIGEK